jgi:hypothetical protein
MNPTYAPRYSTVPVPGWVLATIAFASGVGITILFQVCW